MDNYLDQVKLQRQQELEAKEKQRLHKELIDSASNTANLIAKANEATASSVSKAVEEGANLTSKSISAVEKAVRETDRSKETNQTLADIKKAAEGVLLYVKSIDSRPQPDTQIDLHQEEVVNALTSLVGAIEASKTNITITQDKETAKQLKELKQAIKKLEIVPEVMVTTPEVDTKQLEKIIKDELPKAVTKELDKILKKLPAPSVDTTGIAEAVVADSEITQNILREILNRPQAVPEYPTTITTLDKEYATIIDDTTTANTTYIGKAPIGSATSSAVWQISKLDTSSGLIKTWADGDASFNNVWDDRVSLSYS